LSNADLLQVLRQQEPVWQRWQMALKRRDAAILAIAVVLQFVVLGGMVAKGVLPILTGDTVLLQVAPVDPRDLMRGDYVILSYPCSRVPFDGIDGQKQKYGSDDDWIGRQVYTTLERSPDGRHWTTGRISFAKPKQGTFLRGKIQEWGRIEYGIEAYFVQEGKGLKYEEAVRRRQLWAEMSVAPDGQARLIRLHVE
jgi:uncharacterized membrane-anchored protein